MLEILEALFGSRCVATACEHVFARLQRVLFQVGRFRGESILVHAPWWSLANMPSWD